MPRKYVKKAKVKATTKKVTRKKKAGGFIETINAITKLTSAVEQLTLVVAGKAPTPKLTNATPDRMFKEMFDYGMTPARDEFIRSLYGDFNTRGLTAPQLAALQRNYNSLIKGENFHGT